MTIGLIYYPLGYSSLSWKLNSHEKASYTDIEYQKYIIEKAEKNLFDFIFIPDGLSFSSDNIELLSKSANNYVNLLDPLMLSSFFAANSNNIGIGCSATTTFNDPYHISRKFVSLDFISNGRCGWNIITSQNSREAKHFSDKPFEDKEVRYKKANEFFQVFQKFCFSWRKNALVQDKENGIFLDYNEIDFFEHKGDFFNVSGPLNLSRSPQVMPLIFQSGSSDYGIELGCKHADVIFTAQNSLEEAKTFYHKTKKIIKANNRDVEKVKIILGIVPFIGKTHEEAIEKYYDLHKEIDSKSSIGILENIFHDISFQEEDMNKKALDILEYSENNPSRQEIVLNIAKDNDYTLVDLAKYLNISKGHMCLIGSAEDICEKLKDILKHQGADGFIFIPPILSDFLENYEKYLMPLLLQEKLITPYSNNVTLRERIGCEVYE